MIFKEGLERVKGIEPSYAAWEAAVLPLNYTRLSGAFYSRLCRAMQEHRIQPNQLIYGAWRHDHPSGIILQIAPV